MMDLDSWCSSQFLDVENMKTSVMLSQLIELEIWVGMHVARIESHWCGTTLEGLPTLKVGGLGFFLLGCEERNKE